MLSMHYNHYLKAFPKISGIKKKLSFFKFGKYKYTDARRTHFEIAGNIDEVVVSFRS